MHKKLIPTTFVHVLKFRANAQTETSNLKQFLVVNIMQFIVGVFSQTVFKAVHNIWPSS